MRAPRRSVALAVLCLAGPCAAGATAAEPIMPLADVQKGMRCVAQSVVSGVDIATFDAAVLAVIAGDGAARAPGILLRVSGPAVDETGVGPGFSGSPVSCPDAGGTLRVIGAIAESVGAYGNMTVLATPIELILGEPAEPPAQMRRDPGLRRAARPLATPLSIGGLSAPVARAVGVAARRAGVAVFAAPPAPLAATFPVQVLRGGSAMSVGLASGDVTAGAVGTVAYVDGDRVWSFGHPLDGAGRRSLFLQDAYVYAVIGNPIGSEELTTYKYAAPGHDVGVLTNDGMSAVVGRLGALPARFPLRVVGRDLDSGTVRVANVQLADESALGLPAGSSALTQVGALTIGEVAYELLRGTPLRQSGSMCVRLTLRERRRPLRFCNTYAGGRLDQGAAAALITDFTSATAQLDAYNFGPLHVTSAEVLIRLRRSLRQAYLLAVRAPARVRRGARIRVRVTAQRVNGPRLARTLTVRVPRGTPLGRRRLELAGTPGDGGGSLSDALTEVLDLDALLEDEAGQEDGGAGARSVEALARGIAGVARYDGLTVRFGPAAGSAPGTSGGQRVHRDPELRLSGTAGTTVTVVP